MSNIDKQALNQEKIEWLNKLADMEYCKSNPGHWLMSLKDTNMLAQLALHSQALLDELEAKDKRIAELEAREINLPPYSFFDFKQGSPFKSGAYCHIDSVNKELSKHGIKMIAAAGKGEPS